MGGVIVEVGWCGFGRAEGCDLFPELRLGLLRLRWYRGTLPGVLLRLVLRAREQRS